MRCKDNLHLFSSSRHPEQAFVELAVYLASNQAFAVLALSAHHAAAGNDLQATIKR